ncbi:MAG: hypothetical protein GVY10_10235 [Verrucomicrobia bacterium]|nr:hypothetical protein [Verrucomicrobiota bacterium]
MKRRYFSLLALGLVLMSAVSAIAENPRFGPYEAIEINPDVIRGVKVDDENRIWLLLNPKYKEKELVLRISNRKGAGYRDFENGKKELISPANQGKRAHAWTDWLRTEAAYVEYWMDGRKVLHLKKVE